MRKLILKLFGIDLDKYNNLKSENRRLKNVIKNVNYEVKLQLQEMDLFCKYSAEDIAEPYPKGKLPTDIALTYNLSANTERLVYKQKLTLISNLLK